jgi:hypothetical protein
MKAHFFKFAAPMGLAGILFAAACQTLPLFGPPLACIAGDLASGAIEDPLQIVADCAGATIAAVIAAIEQELANQPAASDAGTSAAGAAPSAPAGAVPSFPGPQRAAYVAHLQRILARAKALQAQGVK